MKQWLEMAVSCAKEAGQLSLKRLKHPLDVTYKTSASDLVTAVDLEVERFVVERILNTYPNHGILGEEGTIDRSLKGVHTVWVIDPIDGTTNFVHQKQDYVVSIAVYHRGEGVVGVVYDPSRDELFHAVRGQGAYLNGKRLGLPEQMSMERALVCTSIFWNQEAVKTGLDRTIQEVARRCRGLRVFGCAALEMAYVAAGRLDAYISLSLNPWDFGAGRILIEEAGGKVTRLNGDPVSFDKKGSILASTPGIYEELLEFMNGRLNW
ncbi:MAG: inositol monophosphatase [Bacillaceae bacterium]|nr:inositol monophosphatase [Bacillaceae bacterium]